MQKTSRSAANVDAGGKTRLASFVHGVLLLLCAVSIPGLLNRIPLSCLAAILLLTGYKLARASLFRQMYRLGFWQFVPFIVTTLGLVLTDMLTGIALGSLIGRYFCDRLKAPLFTYGIGLSALGVASFGTFFAIRAMPDIFIALVRQIGISSESLIVATLALSFLAMAAPDAALALLGPSGSRRRDR